MGSLRIAFCGADAEKRSTLRQHINDNVIEVQGITRPFVNFEGFDLWRDMWDATLRLTSLLERNHLEEKFKDDLDPSLLILDTCGIDELVQMMVDSQEALKEAQTGLQVIGEQPDDSKKMRFMVISHLTQSFLWQTEQEIEHVWDIIYWVRPDEPSILDAAYAELLTAMPVVQDKVRVVPRTDAEEFFEKEAAEWRERLESQKTSQS